MSEVLWILLALVVGAVLGLFYFGGLWLTLERLPGSRRPHVLALLSFFGRTVVVLLVVFLIARQSWQRIAACLVGFVIVRGLMLYRLKPPPSARETQRAQRRAAQSDEGKSP